MDALSQTLRVVRLVGAIFLHARFTAPWCYQSPPARLAAPLLEPGAEEVLIFHLLLQGECVVEMEGQPLVRLSAGDAVLFPNGDAHRMASAPGVAPATGASLDRVLSRRPRLLAHGGGGAMTRLVCGYLACDRQLARLLLAGLPPVVRVRVRDSPAGEWLESSVRYALAEARSPRAGGEGLLSKIAEVLVIELLRLHALDQAPDRTGWLAGVADRIVGAALRSLHERPAHAWTLEELASSSGASRSVLAERFLHLVGVPPMQYLTKWRMMLAANLLSGGNMPLSRVAEEVGYQTDAAFSRAFSREYGIPPATWRRDRVSRDAAFRTPRQERRTPEHDSPREPRASCNSDHAQLGHDALGRRADSTGEVG